MSSTASTVSNLCSTILGCSSLTPCGIISTVSTSFNRQFFNCVAHQAFVMYGVILLGVETKKSLYKSAGPTAEGATAPSELQIRALEEHQAVNLGLVGYTTGLSY